MSSESRICICDKDWCQCDNVTLVDDYAPEELEVPCKDCLKGIHVE